MTSRIMNFLAWALWILLLSGLHDMQMAGNSFIDCSTMLTRVDKPNPMSSCVGRCVGGHFRMSCVQGYGWGYQCGLFQYHDAISFPEPKELGESGPRRIGDDTECVHRVFEMKDVVIE